MKIKSIVRFELTLDVEVSSTGKHTLNLDQINAEAMRAARGKLEALMDSHSGVELVEGKTRVTHITTLEQP